MAATASLFLSALVKAVTNVDVDSLLNDELSDFSRELDIIWDGVTASMSESDTPMDFMTWMHVYSDDGYTPHDSWHYHVLSTLSDVIESCWEESEIREYKYGDSDWNPYSRLSIESYSDRTCHRSSTLPRKHTTHASRKRAIRMSSDQHRILVSSSNNVATYDEDIPF